MFRRTKIVATLGPATDDPQILRDMIAAGLDMARINFSHGTREDMRRRIVQVREAAREVDRPVGILADLAGPKIRIESFAGGPIHLSEGQPFALDTSLDPSGGNEREVGCAYKDLPRDVKPGDSLLLEVANRLKASVRSVDTVARFGGDEFVVILGQLDARKLAATSQVSLVAEKIRASLAEPYRLRITRLGNADLTVEHRCTASIGIVMAMNHELSQDDMLKRADTAMYQAKDAGRNAIRFHEVKVPI